MASKSKRDARSDRKVSVEVDRLSKSYGDVKALSEISFKVHAGEIVGFVGPNGAGKTTTMKILTSFIGATSGTAKVSGFDVVTQSMEVRSKVGYLPETVPLYPDMLVYDYLKFVAQMRGVAADQIHTSIKETSKVCGISHMANRYIGELSKGYRQRVGLAQALIHKPEVVILDEPTSGLDPNQIIEIRDLIKEIGKEKTIIFSTHILQEVAAVCDRIIVINQGKLVADGSLDELRTRVSREAMYLITVAPKGQSNTSSKEIIAALKKVSSVKEADSLAAPSGEMKFFVTAKRGSDIRHDVSHVVESLSLALLEFHREVIDLEDIFRSLTGGKNRVVQDHKRRAKALAGEADNVAEAPEKKKKKKKKNVADQADSSSDETQPTSEKSDDVVADTDDDQANTREEEN